MNSIYQHPDGHSLDYADNTLVATDSDGREYLFTTDGMREATKGIDFKRALDVLQEAKALPTPGANGERARFIRI
ncbi:MAG: hypothetical protein ACOYMG_21430, partial [Candidatus Methylumidiphilus sp.]